MVEEKQEGGHISPPPPGKIGLRSFQYKILNNTLYLNECLFKFNIVDSPLCSLCKQENESVIHLFAIRSEARSLLDQLSTWISRQNTILFPK